MEINNRTVFSVPALRINRVTRIQGSEGSNIYRTSGFIFEIVN